MRNFVLGLAAAAAIATVAAPAQAGETLDAVKARGTFKCGQGTGTPGFGFADDKGVWQGLNADLCRAIATAVFADPAKVDFVSLTAQQRFPAVQTGEVDAIAGNTTFTLTRDTKNGLNFAPPFFYDGQAMMVRKDLGVSSARDLNGATVCLQPGTTSELNITDYFRANGMEFTPVVIENVAEVRSAFFSGRCDVYTTDASLLAGARVASEKPDDYVILPERISKEPLAAIVRHGDDQWYDIVRWTMYVLIEAEELGITRDNADTFLDNANPSIRRFLGEEPGLGEALGVDDKFAYNIIKAVGNYGEIYDRWVGPDTPLALERGLNKLWRDGGLMYAAPFR
jgi:ABC-type amino acid transport/signal transduction systems, periplasmic component/domain